MLTATARLWFIIWEQRATFPDMLLFIQIGQYSRWIKSSSPVSFFEIEREDGFFNTEPHLLSSLIFLHEYRGLSSVEPAAELIVF